MTRAFLGSGVLIDAVTTSMRVAGTRSANAKHDWVIRAAVSRAPYRGQRSKSAVLRGRTQREGTVESLRALRSARSGGGRGNARRNDIGSPGGSSATGLVTVAVEACVAAGGVAGVVLQ